MEDVDFTDDEIFKELADLGYCNIPVDRFRQFKKELFELIRHERSVSQSSSSNNNSLSVIHSDDTGRGSSQSDRSLAVCSSRVKSTSTYNKENMDQRHSKCRDSERLDTEPDIHDDDDEDDETRLSRHYNEQCRRDNIMKRKTLRRCDDGQLSVSESFTESDNTEAADVAGVERLLRKTSLLNNSAVSRRPISAPPQLSANHSADPHQSHTACRQLTSYNLPDDYQGPKSLIHAMPCAPHVRHIKKSDPVSRYHSYKHSWTTCQAPGDKPHKQLRWGVREMMCYHDNVIDKKPQRCYRANSYVIPSDKKRKTLRWQIRANLAQGVKPPSAFD